jgi:hypothetical protein
MIDGEGIMQSSPPVFLLLLILDGVLGLVAVIAGFRLRPVAPSRGITLIAILPGLATLGLFYSLAIHMHQSLGGWPTSIGERGFPSPLVTHAGIATGWFAVLFLASVVAWPIALVLCALVRRWRGGVFYLGAYALSCLICCVGMLIAPAPFLYWWWD